jgi:hypothetical protein
VNHAGTVVKFCSSYKSLFGGMQRVDDTFPKDQAASTKDSPEMTPSGTKFSLTNRDWTNDNDKKKNGNRLNKWNE